MTLSSKPTAHPSDTCSNSASAIPRYASESTTRVSRLNLCLLVIEVEFKEDRAAEACLTLSDAGKRLPEAIWRYVIGAFDFRVKNGRTELQRRPLVDWWESYIGQAYPLETKPIKKDSSLVIWFGWFRTSAGPRLLQLANILGITPHELFEQLIEELEPATTVVPAVVDANGVAKTVMGNRLRTQQGTLKHRGS